jgi:hypothetical protein
MKTHSIASRLLLGSFPVGCAFSALTFVATFVVACSPSSESSTSESSSPAKLGGSDKLKTCNNDKFNHPQTSVDVVCDPCVASKCAAESTHAIGSDPTSFSGASGPFIQCLCDCASTDSSCMQSCSKFNDQPSKDAIAAALACEHSKCATECAKPDGG